MSRANSQVGLLLTVTAAAGLSGIYLDWIGQLRDRFFPAGALQVAGLLMLTVIVAAAATLLAMHAGVGRPIVLMMAAAAGGLAAAIRCTSTRQSHSRPVPARQ